MANDGVSGRKTDLDVSVPAKTHILRLFNNHAMYSGTLRLRYRVNIALSGSPGWLLTYRDIH